MSELSIPVEGAVLAARVSQPADRPAPVLVALHGAERGVRDWYLYEHLHEVLPPAGIAVVTFDRRGEGGSTGESSRGQFTGDRGPLEAAVAEGRAEEWWGKAFFPGEVPGDEAREEVREELDSAWREARGDAVDVTVVPGTGHEPADGEAVSPLYEQAMLEWLQRVA